MPEDFGRYEVVLPGAAERILSMAEKQADHRRTLESTVIHQGSRDSLLGMITGFIIALSFLASGTYIVLKGFSWQGVAIATGCLVSLVSVFVYGWQERRKEREFKERQLIQK